MKHSLADSYVSDFAFFYHFFEFLPRRVGVLGKFEIDFILPSILDKCDGPWVDEMSSNNNFHLEVLTSVLDKGQGNLYRACSGIHQAQVRHLEGHGTNSIVWTSAKYLCEQYHFL